MNGVSQVQYQTILDIADQLESLKTEITTLLESEVKPIYLKIGNESQAVWEGSAAVTARTQFDTLMGTFEQFEKAIQDQYVYLRGAVANYKAVDVAASQFE